MARAFDDASSQYLQNNNVIVADDPCTFACWFRADDDTISSHLVSIANSASNAGEISLESRGAHGDVIGFIHSDGTVGGRASSTTSWTANTWRHAAGVLVGNSSRFAYLDGGGKGSNTTTIGTGTYTRTAIARLPRLSPASYYSGSIAEVGIWSAALTDAEIAILALGYSPLLVRPQSLVAYWPLIGRTSPEIDRVGGYNMTLVNAPTTAVHPRVIYPTYQAIWTPPPAAGAIMQQLQRANLGASLYQGTII